MERTRPLERAELLEVCRGFAARDVDFVLIGGGAGMLHGAQAGTRDIDVLVALGVENLQRIAAAIGDVAGVDVTDPGELGWSTTRWETRFDGALVDVLPRAAGPNNTKIR